jgi:sulfatase modifying factor 1
MTVAGVSAPKDRRRTSGMVAVAGGSSWIGSEGHYPEERPVHDDPRGARTSPVGAYRPNGYGLVDMIGNVWEWTSSPWTPDHSQHALARTGCWSPAVEAAVESDRGVVKGGSYLCAPTHCRRYRPSARQRQAVSGSTGHLGFRCVVDAWRRGGARDAVRR